MIKLQTTHNLDTNRFIILYAIAVAVAVVVATVSYKIKSEFCHLDCVQATLDILFCELTSKIEIQIKIYAQIDTIKNMNQCER